jgi:hypothetical protein
MMRLRRLLLLLLLALPILSLPNTTEVQVITARWCGRCKTVKPEVETICRMNGLNCTIIKYETMSEAEQDTIRYIPTIRVRQTPDQEWTHYTVATLEKFNQDIKMKPRIKI